MAPSFWAHSYKARRLAEAQQEKREREHQQRVIAEAALAGWRFIHQEKQMIHDEFLRVWATYDPQGRFHGTNASIYGAAQYALAEMNHSFAETFD